MNIKAIPTVYKDVQFRSRLEARWACFFDLLRWPWAYEPVDLDGWIPDFILGENIDTGIPCEVKPLDFMGLSRADREKSWQPHIHQLNRATSAVGPDGGFMLLGTRPFWGGDFYKFDELGKDQNDFHLCDVGLSFFPKFHKFNWAERLSCRDSDQQLDFVLEQAPYRGAITGDDFDTSNNDQISPFVTWESQIEHLWKQASNTVQWKAP